MKNVMISELKAHLSEILSSVRRGEKVIVCDRRTPVAMLSPFEDRVNECEIRDPIAPMSAFGGVQKVKLGPGPDALKVLEDLREDAI